MPALYPGAIWRPSIINHPDRPDTLGIVIHWTVGREAGDITVLDGPSVDVHFYVAKDGDVYQFLPLDSQAWHAKFLANRHTIGIETEGRGEPWTDVQFEEVAKLTAWLCQGFDIPVKHADPSGTDLNTFKGIFGHRDLSVGGERVDGNDHTDTVPDDPGWDRFLAKVGEHMEPPKDTRTLKERLHAAGYSKTTVKVILNRLRSGVFGTKPNPNDRKMFDNLRREGIGVDSARKIIKTLRRR